MSEKASPDEGVPQYNTVTDKTGTPHGSTDFFDMKLKESNDVEQGGDKKTTGPGYRRFGVRRRDRWYQFWRFKSDPPPPPLSMDDSRQIPLAYTNWYMNWSYEWITPLLFLGYRRPIEPEDLWKLDGPRQAETLSERLIVEWEKRVAK